MHNLWGSSFFSKCSKFDLVFRYAAKNSEKSFSFLDNDSWICCGKFFLLQGEYWSSAVNVLTNTPKVEDVTKTDIFQLNSCQSGAVQSFRLFNMLTVEGCSKTWHFRHLTNHVFHSLQVRKYITWEGHFFF